MIELRKRDWEEAKEQAEQILRQTEISRIVNENLLNISNDKIKDFPEEISNTDSDSVVD